MNLEKKGMNMDMLTEYLLEYARKNELRLLALWMNSDEDED